MSSFFTPTSQKKPDQITWRIVNNSLVVGKFSIEPGSKKEFPGKPKIAAFDFVSQTTEQLSHGCTRRCWKLMAEGRTRLWFQPHRGIHFRETLPIGSGGILPFLLA